MMAAALYGNMSPTFTWGAGRERKQGTCSLRAAEVRGNDDVDTTHFSEWVVDGSTQAAETSLQAFQRLWLISWDS
jgi:hypothetical protein